LILALLPLLVLKKYNLALRTLPVLFNTMDSMLGEATGKVLSTPTPSEIFLTVNVACACLSLALDYITLETLDSLLVSFDDFIIYGDIVTCFEGGMV